MLVSGTEPGVRMAARIEDYALIGDTETAALVSRQGAIDWFCAPRFDSAACLAGLLGSDEHGSWSLAPVETPTRIERRYRGNSLVLVIGGARGSTSGVAL